MIRKKVASDLDNSRKFATSMGRRSEIWVTLRPIWYWEEAQDMGGIERVHSGGTRSPFWRRVWFKPPAQVPERRFPSLGRNWMICIFANMNLPTIDWKDELEHGNRPKGGMTSSSSEVPQGHPLGSVFEAQGFSRTPWGSHRIKPVDFGTGGFVGTIFSRGASKSRTLSKKWSSQRWFWTLASKMTVVSVDGWPCSGFWKKR